jgi:hypothetical protein
VKKRSREESETATDAFERAWAWVKKRSREESETATDAFERAWAWSDKGKRRGVGSMPRGGRIRA